MPSDFDGLSPFGSESKRLLNEMKAETDDYRIHKDEFKRRIAMMVPVPPIPAGGGKIRDGVVVEVQGDGGNGHPEYKIADAETGALVIETFQRAYNEWHGQIAVTPAQVGDIVLYWPNTTQKNVPGIGTADFLFVEWTETVGHTPCDLAPLPPGGDPGDIILDEGGGLAGQLPAQGLSPLQAQSLARVIPNTNKKLFDYVLSRVAALDNKRVWQSVLSGAGSLLGIADTAYWVYVGTPMRNITVKHVEFYVRTVATSTQDAEIALASTPLPPNKAAQTLTKLTADGTLDDLTVGTTVKRNTTTLAYEVMAGTHLWAGIRTNMAGNEPTYIALTNDFAEGLCLSTATAGDLVSGSSWTGSTIAATTAGMCPDLRVVCD